MARVLAVNLDVEADLVPAAEALPAGGPASCGTRAASQNARVLQERLHDAFAAPAPDEAGRELSAFARLAVIVGASGLLWGAIALGVAAVL